MQNILNESTSVNMVKDQTASAQLYHRFNDDPIRFDSYDSDEDPSISSQSSTKCDYNLEDALTYIGIGKFQWFVMALNGLLWFCAAIQLMCSSILLLNLQNSDLINITQIEENILTSFPFMGEIFGAFLLPRFSDKFGRKKAILISALFMAFFGTLAAISWDFYMLLSCRFFCGCAVGGASTCLSLITEFIPQKYRGEMMYLDASFWSLGSIYAILIGMFIV